MLKWHISLKGVMFFYCLSCFVSCNCHCLVFVAKRIAVIFKFNFSKQNKKALL